LLKRWLLLINLHLLIEGRLVMILEQALPCKV